MPKIRSLPAALATLTLVLSCTASASALAVQNSTTSNSSTENSTSNTTSTTSSESGGESTARERGQALLKEMRDKNKSTKSAAQLKTVCQNHKISIDGKAHGLLVNSQRVLKNVNSVYDKAKAYQQKKNLQPTGWQDLIAKADLAKAQATTSVNTQSTSVPAVHCDDPSTTTQDLATYKAAVQQSRDDLKAYRDAVKNVLKALETTGSSNS
jgi:hypothetical protein